MADRAGLGDDEQRRARLIEVLRTRPDDTACGACLDQLDDYVAAQLGSQDYAARFPDVAVHLDACPDCAGAYARLYDVEWAAATGRLFERIDVPTADLSFLASRARVDTLAERLRAALRRVGDRLTLQLSADLLPSLQPSLALAPVRAPADAERYGEVLLELQPDEALRADLPITLTAYRDANRPEECLIEVTVEPPGRSWPDLENIPVSLVFGSERRAASTDAWGLASFESVPVSGLPHLAVEVMLA